MASGKHTCPFRPVGKALVLSSAQAGRSNTNVIQSEGEGEAAGEGDRGAGEPETVTVWNVDEDQKTLATRWRGERRGKG